VVTTVQFSEQPLFFFCDVQVGIFKTVHLNVDVELVLELSLKSLENARELHMLTEWDLIDQTLVSRVIVLREPIG
jgi:hypothetical protein